MFEDDDGLVGLLDFLEVGLTFLLQGFEILLFKIVCSVQSPAALQGGFLFMLIEDIPL